MAISQLADKIFDFAKLGKLPSFILAFVSWTFILLPKSVKNLLNIGTLFENCAILFTSYFIGFSLFEILRGQITGQRTIRIVKKRLKNLSDDEKILLRNYISDKKRTASFHMSEGIAEGLVAKKILYRSSTISLGHDVFSYNIQDIAYDYLMKNRHLIE